MIRSIFLLTIAALLLAACAPARQAQNLPPATETLTSNPAMLVDASEYARQNNVSLSEALRRLSVQDKIGELGAALEREQAETFAGLWIEHQPRFRVVAAFTQNGAQTIRPYLEGKPYADLVEVRVFPYSLAELQAAQQQTGQAAQSLGISITSGIDVMRNQVTVEVGNPRLYAEELQQAGITLPEMVEVTAFDPDRLAGTLRGEVETYTSPGGQTIYFPKQAPTNVHLEALFGGKLVLDDKGCLRAGGGELILWHADFTLRVTGERVEVLNGEGLVVARVGEEMTGGGGEVPFTNIPGLPLEDCPTEYYWQLGDIKPLS